MINREKKGGRSQSQPRSLPARSKKKGDSAHTQSRPSSSGKIDDIAHTQSRPSSSDKSYVPPRNVAVAPASFKDIVGSAAVPPTVFGGMIESLTPPLLRPVVNRSYSSSQRQAFQRVFDLDQSGGSLCVDLTSASLSPSHSSASFDHLSSRNDSLSEGDDNPDEDFDKFIEVISRRAKRNSSSRSRVRGPLSL